MLGKVVNVDGGFLNAVLFEELVDLGDFGFCGDGVT